MLVSPGPETRISARGVAVAAGGVAHLGPGVATLIAGASAERNQSDKPRALAAIMQLPRKTPLSERAEAS
jgi:hypothetical protein